MAERFTTEQMIAAIRQSRGIKSAVARALGCDRRTVDNYIARHATVRDAYQEERETTIDAAELQLMRKVNEGELPAVFFILKTLGKSRGYVERQENVNFNVPPELVQRLISTIESAGMSAADVFNGLIAELDSARTGAPDNRTG